MCQRQFGHDYLTKNPYTSFFCHNNYFICKQYDIVLINNQMTIGAGIDNVG